MVIVPVFNVQDYIARCLQSIAEQTYKNLKVLIVDDGSTDDTPRIINQWLEKDERFNMIRQENHGVAHARNTAIEAIDCPLVTMVDGDDVIAPDMIETLVGLLNGTPDCDLAVGNFKITANVELWKPGNGSGKVTVFDKAGALKNILYQKREINHSPCGRIYRSHVLTDLHYPDYKIYEDLAVIIAIVNQCRKIAYLDRQLYCYRQRPGSITHVFNPQRQHVIDNLETMEAEASRDGSQNGYLLPAIRSRLSSACFNMLKLMPKGDPQYDDLEKRCITIIKRIRRGVLSDRETRFRNRVALLLSYLPTPLLKRVLSLY